jgi:hypothetical protein
MRLQHALINLALSQEPESIRFKDQFYEWDGQPFSLTDVRGYLQYPFLLFVVLSGVGEQVF